ncbi:GNAT family N-acetyltransferase [Flavobacterium branchiarum]|uniref:GNAT family N-acetyltransferase n=1 Tax=Flavobacterium branchiarum TaxID=1114870 RepID=A0ABV5FKG7_9FLAO|nr:GNAT family N-acetyltransferase [Flavobacterium branchiarum]MDN3672400.1 GNAT family N-acetyltransferase [Flavobacterium branchiarum]
MKVESLKIKQLTTERLLLIPFTIQICKNVLNDDYSDLERLNLKKGKSWPDNDVIETLPRIITNLLKVTAPTGFESWMIIKKDTSEIIGDLGFKGFNPKGNNIDLGYGIIKEERRKGFAEEAVKEIINWAFSNEIIKEITASCLTENTSSINLLTKFNFSQLKTENGMIYWSLENKGL